MKELVKIVRRDDGMVEVTIDPDNENDVRSVASALVDVMSKHIQVYDFIKSTVQVFEELRLLQSEQQANQSAEQPDEAPRGKGKHKLLPKKKFYS